MEYDMNAAEPLPGAEPPPEAPTEAEAPPKEAALVRQIQKRIRADKAFHKSAFERMKKAMFLSTNGREKDDPADFYAVNIAGRHAKMKTAALYAKNPRIVARRRETLDFALWDENPQTAMLAMQAVQMAPQLVAAGPAPQIDPMTGQPMQPVIPPEVQQAMDLMADIQQGLQRREQMKKLGRTLEVLFSHAMTEQKPLEFKAEAKRAVGRAVVTGVAYVELGFQRETGPRPGLSEQLADARERLDHLRRLAADVAEGEIDPDDAEMAELEASVAALMAEPEIVLREGLIFDWPASTAVIPDSATKRLAGFVGARHVTVEYTYTVDQCRELFPDFDAKRRFEGTVPGFEDDSDSPNIVRDEDEPQDTPKKSQMVTVWKHYDKPSGLVYYVADGYAEFLRPSAAPDVFVEDFWPIYPLTFNDTENEDQLFPPSDVELLRPMQLEYNRARQGMREHRRAARPRFAISNGAMDDADFHLLTTSAPFTVAKLNVPPATKIADILQPITIPGVDPNLYETSPIFQDAQLAVGAQESSYGGVAKATATESAIAANSTQSSDQASIDELDAWLSRVARGASQILLREMSPEQVQKIAGIGAFWPPMTLADIAGEIYLEVEAGSSGRPNQAVEINNMERLLPLLLQMPNIEPMWLVKQVLQRLDDRLDLTDAVVAGLPAIVAQNRMQQPMPADPNAAPDAQGQEGADNGPQPQEPAGTNAAFGSNQV